MIIIEFMRNFLKNIFYVVLRFPFWLITARDCDHCKYHDYLLYDCGIADTCRIGNREKEDVCKSTVTRKYFERKWHVKEKKN